MKHTKRLLTVAVLMLILVSQPALAKERNRGLKPSAERTVHHPVSFDLAADESLPPQYKSQYYTEINDQGATGLCWAFGNTSALEGSLNKKYSASGNAAISWKNLAYYSWHKNSDSSAKDAGDYMEYIFDKQSFDEGPGEEEGYEGGRYYGDLSHSGYGGWDGPGYGPGYGDDDPGYGSGYGDDDPGYGPGYGDDNPSYGPGYGDDDPGQGGWDNPGGGGGYQTKTVDCTGNGNDSAYLFLGGTEYGASILFSQGRCLTDDTGDNAIAGDLNNISGCLSQAKKVGKSDDDAYRIKDAYYVSGDESNKDVIKRMIMSYGAGAISYYPGDEGEELPAYVNNSEKNIEDIKKEEGVECINDHTITLVGWDDGISRSKFQNSPAGDGAWICINSYGSGSGNGTENGLTYISYYDPSIDDSDIIFYDAYKKGDSSANVTLWTDNNYGVEAGGDPRAETDDRARGLAYKADKDVTVKAVSVLAAEDGAAYTLTVLGNPSITGGVIDNEKQTPLLSMDLSFERAGIHVINLDRKIGIKSGQTAVFMLKPKKSLKTFVSKAEDIKEEAEWVDNGTENKEPTEDYYLGIAHIVSASSGLSLSEDADGIYYRMDDGDIYYRALSDDGIDPDAVTFEGSDFDMSKLRSDKVNYYEFKAGADEFVLSWTKTVPYTGYPHVTESSSNKKTADLSITILKNGTELPKSEYKVKFKNNKLASAGASGSSGRKSPAMYVKLKGKANKDANKQLKSKALGFEIRQADLASDLNFDKFDFKTNKSETKVTKIFGLSLASTGKPVKYKLSKNGTKGDITATITDQRTYITVTLTGINNCKGSIALSYEVQQEQGYQQ